MAPIEVARNAFQEVTSGPSAHSHDGSSNPTAGPANTKRKYASTTSLKMERDNDVSFATGIAVAHPKA
jgi:hypothetical protein